MNPPSEQPPSDPDLDRLLASRLRRTSPEFELRWRELRGRLVHPPPPAHKAWFNRWAWPGVATAMLAVAVLMFALRHASRPAATPGPMSFEELVSLDAALAVAGPLLDPETRDALIHLPVSR